MPGTRYSRLQGIVAQATVFLLLVQVVFGVGACRQYNLADTDDIAALRQAGVICTVHGIMPAAPESSKAPAQENPSGDPQHQCPACASFVCHATAILAADAALPDTPAGNTGFAVPPLPMPAGIQTADFRNRGPPLPIHT